MLGCSIRKRDYCPKDIHTKTPAINKAFTCSYQLTCENSIMSVRELMKRFENGSSQPQTSSSSDKGMVNIGVSVRDRQRMLFGENVQTPSREQKSQPPPPPRKNPVTKVEESKDEVDRLAEQTQTSTPQKRTGTFFEPEPIPFTPQRSTNQIPRSQPAPPQRENKTKDEVDRLVEHTQTSTPQREVRTMGPFAAKSVPFTPSRKPQSQTPPSLQSKSTSSLTWACDSDSEDETDMFPESYPTPQRKTKTTKSEESSDDEFERLYREFEDHDPSNGPTPAAMRTDTRKNKRCRFGSKCKRGSKCPYNHDHVDRENEISRLQDQVSRLQDMNRILMEENGKLEATNSRKDETITEVRKQIGTQFAQLREMEEDKIRRDFYISHLVKQNRIQEDRIRELETLLEAVITNYPQQTHHT